MLPPAAGRLLDGPRPCRVRSSMPPAPPAPVPPHPLLPALYRDNDEKRQWLRRIFDDTAGDYDRVESWLSLGSGRWYRRQALRRAGASEGVRGAGARGGDG